MWKKRDLCIDFQSKLSTIYGLEGSKMNITNDIKPISHLKAKAADLLKQVNETRRPVVITRNGEPRDVLQDPESCENMRSAIGVLKLISQGEADIRRGAVKSQEAVFNDLEASFKDQPKRHECMECFR
jgi:prevent-host-death family protein